MDMADWDLHAVVRGCSATATTAAAKSTAATCCSSAAITTTPATPAAGSSFFEPPQLDENFFNFQDLFFEQNLAAAELHDLYKPFYTVSPPQQPLLPQPPLQQPPPQQPPPQRPLSPPQQNVPISPLSVLGGLQDLAQKSPEKEPQPQQQQQQQVYQPKQRAAAVPSRTKRRKNQLKKVCQVPAEALASDSWSWRKYGQKPIKGSPYPRGYYRCSTSKSCMARKQVERNRSDPGMFIVTYASEHNHPMPTHRNSLAGSTRNKQSTTVSGEPSKPSGSPPVSPSASLSSAPGKLELESSKDEVNAGGEDEDDAVNGCDMAVDDEFFTGLEEFAMVGENDFLNMQFPWLSNNANTTTAAAAGGDS